MKPIHRNRGRLSSRLQRDGIPLLAALLLVLVGWEISRRVTQATSIASAAATVRAERGLAEVLAHGDRRLAEARAGMAGGAGRGHAALRVASIEMSQSRTLFLLAYEQRQVGRAKMPGLETPDDVLFRERYLRADANGSITRAAAAARTALRAGLEPASRRIALLILAQAQGALGNRRAEIEVLVELTRAYPNDSGLWWRLSTAAARSRQFARAEAAMQRALSLCDPSPPPFPRIARKARKR